jgi:hypothetical protein
MIKKPHSRLLSIFSFVIRCKDYWFFKGRRTIKSANDPVLGLVDQVWSLQELPTFISHKIQTD